MSAAVSPEVFMFRPSNFYYYFGSETIGSKITRADGFSEPLRLTLFKNFGERFIVKEGLNKGYGLVSTMTTSLALTLQEVGMLILFSLA